MFQEVDVFLGQSGFKSLYILVAGAGETSPHNGLLINDNFLLHHATNEKPNMYFNIFNMKNRYFNS